MKKNLLAGLLIVGTLFLISNIFDKMEDPYPQEDPNFSEDLDTSEIPNSYNAYLYSTGNLSEVISADAFGFLVSKYTNNADRRLETGNFVPINIALQTSNYEEYINWLTDQEINYVYEDLYALDNAYEKICYYQDHITEQKTFHEDSPAAYKNIPTVDQVYDTILSNSNAYLNENEGYYRLDSTEMTLIAEILVNMLSEYYDALDQQDISRIYCMLNDVTAVGINSSDFTVNDLLETYNARVTEDAVIMLDMEMMKNLHGNQILERTIAHEVAHLFQRMCPDHKIKGLTQIGSSQYVEAFDDTGEVNSLHFQWLYEAAAELMSMNEYDVKTPLVYKNMVGYLNTLNLITLLRSNYDEKSILVSQMSTNADTLYDLFDAKTQEERDEISHMLYSICYIQTERDDFTTAYSQKYGDIDGQEITIKKIMKESVARTMTKYFYKNLAEQVHNGNVTLQDVFYLINTFEAALSLHIVYDEEERREYIDEVIEFYVEAQDKFFSMIASDSGIPFGEILERFDHYALIIDTDHGYERNYQLSWLSQDEKDYIGRVLTTNIQYLTENIRKY